jgi:sulfotransferase famil protein
MKGVKVPLSDLWPRKNIKKTFFLHIPKCAGTSIWSTLRKIYGSKNTYVVGIERDLGALAAMSLSRRLKYSAVGGHAQLPLFRELLGNLSSYYKIVTFRDPIDRLVSEYNYVRAYDKHPQHERVCNESFDTFVRSYPSNRQVQLLTGCNDDVATALELVHGFFDDWSLMSGTDQLLQRLCHVLGVAPKIVVPKNKTEHQFTRAEIPRDTLKFLEAHHSADLELLDRLSVVVKPAFAS